MMQDFPIGVTCILFLKKLKKGNYSEQSHIFYLCAYVQLERGSPSIPCAHEIEIHPSLCLKIMESPEGVSGNESRNFNCQLILFFFP